MPASCYLGLGFLYLRKSLCVMVVTWLPTEFKILTVVHWFKCIFNLEPRAVNMLQAPLYLNPALRTGQASTLIFSPPTFEKYLHKVSNSRSVWRWIHDATEKKLTSFIALCLTLIANVARICRQLNLCSGKQFSFKPVHQNKAQFKTVLRKALVVRLLKSCKGKLNAKWQIILMMWVL